MVLVDNLVLDGFVDAFQKQGCWRVTLRLRVGRERRVGGGSAGLSVGVKLRSS